MPGDGKSLHGLTGIRRPDVHVDRAENVTQVGKQGKSEFAHL